MKKNIKVVLILALQTLVPALAFAGPPVKYPNCAKSLQVKAVPNGSGVFFDETCSVAYVLPPMQGKLEINGLTPNTNLRLCASYEQSMTILESNWAHLKAVSDQINQSLKPKTNDSSIGDDTSIDGSGPVSSPAPQVVVVDPRLDQEYQSTLARIVQTQQAMALFENDKKGVAVGKINYFTNWNELVEKYKDLNPKIHFERLPLEAGRIVFARKVGATGENVTGAVAHTVQGIENTSGILPDGTLQSTSGAVIMSDAVSGQVVLNLAGACPFVKNGKMPADISSSQVDAYLAANFQYRYSLQSLKTYTASYNLASIAKHIQENRSSGGFFSTKTENSITNSNSSSDEFNMQIDSNQEGYEFDANLKTEVKTEVIARVLREMADVTGQPVVVPPLTPPSANGATALAGGLRLCPNLYCQIGAAGLKVLDSIFGNSSAVASYIREKNGVSVDRVSEKKMFSYLGSMVFSGAQK